MITKLRGDEHSHAPEARPLGTYSAYLPPRYRGDAGAYLSSLEKLRLAARARPRLARASAWRISSPRNPRSHSRNGATCLKMECARCRLCSPITRPTVAISWMGIRNACLPDLYYLGDFSGAAVYGFFASSRFFLVDAPGGPGLRDFVRSRLVELGLKPADPTAVLLTSCAPEATGGPQGADPAE